jgi:hypothetical protein
MAAGRGRYIDDLQKPGMVHATFVRSVVDRGGSWTWMSLRRGKRQELRRGKKVGDQGVDDLAEGGPAASDLLLGVGQGPRPPLGVDYATR